MKRRELIRGAAIAGLAAPLATPAIAQGTPTVNWRLSSAFPKSLDILYGTGELLSSTVSDLTDGKFKIQSFASGEIVGTGGLLDAISDGTVEMGHTAAYYYYGKGASFALLSAIPFGMNTRGQNAWLYEGGGIELANEFLAKYNVMQLPGGHTGTQMGGWFREEVNGVEDLDGLKFRVAGMAGMILEKLGVVPQQIAPGDIYSALERGTIDAVEFSGPYDDEKLGFVQVAPYYYFPGFWEGGPTTHFIFNLDAWNDLPESYRAALRAASALANSHMTARYDANNASALRSLLRAGAQLRAFDPSILEAAYAASQETYEDLMESDEDFKTLYSSYRDFQQNVNSWFRINEFTYDSFMYSRQR